MSESGLGLQPVTEKKESVRTKSNSGLHLIAAFYPFNSSADPAGL